MRGLTVVVFLIFLSSCKEKKTTYIDKDNRFGVNFYSTPNIQRDSIETEIGIIPFSNYSCETKDQNIQMVSYSDYPRKTTSTDASYTLLESAKVSAFENLGIKKILTEEKIVKNNCPGLNIVGTNDKDMFVHYQLFICDSTLYQVGILKLYTLNESEEDINFINSFSINP